MYVLSWNTQSFSVTFRRPLVIAGTFETVGETEEDSVVCEAAGYTVFTEMAVADVTGSSYVTFEVTFDDVAFSYQVRYSAVTYGVKYSCTAHLLVV
jgi:hypothetical protein